ncbi:MAG: hypothetical protein Q4G51_13955 [Dermatophilus congolensis]|nr:hypothetical protein [Dermatophilus congolensis]
MQHESVTQRAANAQESASPFAERPTQFDLMASATVLSIAATAWFLWGRADGIATTPLLVGAALAVVMLVVAITRLRSAQGPSTMAVDAQARRMYWIGTGGEIVAIPLAAIFLARAQLHELIPAAVLAIVALHFIPLAIAFRLFELWWVIGACLVVCAAAVWMFAAGHDGARALTGGLGGAVLLTAAAAFVLRANAKGRAKFTP